MTVADPKVTAMLETLACAVESCLVVLQDLQPESATASALRLRLRYWQHALADARQALRITCPDSWEHSTYEEMPRESQEHGN